jgi:Red chlorophyll catabolite reductase (RCC reductase)
MTAETTTSIADIHAQSATVDTTAEFDQLQSAMQALFDKVSARFELEPDPSVAEFDSYGVDGGPTGSIHAYTGPEVDWMVHSWIGNPALGFTNLHLTVWNGPHTLVPHLGIAWGTLPDYWYFVDYVPRVDLLADAEYLDRYYEPHNTEFMELRDEPGFSPFVSQTLYIRQSVSHTAMCAVVERRPDAADRMIELAGRRVDDWLAHIEEGHPVPASDRAALAERDLYVRRTVAERDPANVMGERFFGAEMTDRLVRSLWGGDRELPRPT